MDTFNLVVNEIATTLDVPISALRPETRLADIGMDSLQGLQLLVALEETAGIQLEEADFKRFTTVRSIVELLNSKWPQAGAA